MSRIHLTFEELSNSSQPSQVTRHEELVVSVQYSKDMEGSQNLREVLGKASGPISLHTCISEEVQKQLADTPFVEKGEAREVELCREVHLGLQILWKLDTVP